PWRPRSHGPCGWSTCWRGTKLSISITWGALDLDRFKLLVEAVAQEAFAVIHEAMAHQTMVTLGRLGSGQTGAGDRARALWQKGLLDMLGVDWLAGFLIDELLAQPIASRLVDLPVGDALCGRAGGVQCDRARGQGQLDVAFPVGTHGLVLG